MADKKKRIKKIYWWLGGNIALIILFLPTIILHTYILIYGIPSGILKSLINIYSIINFFYGFFPSYQFNIIILTFLYDFIIGAVIGYIYGMIKYGYNNKT